MSEELFEQKYEQAPAQKKESAASALLEQANEKKLLDVAARLKILEERYGNSMRREQLAEQNALAFEKDMRSELRALKNRLVETKKHATAIAEHLETLQEQIGNAAQKYDVRVLESYLNMVQPLQFMTRAEAKELLKEHRESLEEKEEDV